MEMQVKNKLVTILLALMGFAMIGGCATLEPNSDELAADMESYKGNYGAAIALVQRHAEAGEPWAQLRLGIMYDDAAGPKKGLRTAIERYERKEYIPTAIEWYKKAAAQKATGEWAEGVRFANIYLKGQGVSKDLEQAYLNIRAVVDETKGQGIYFCCEFAGGNYVSALEIAKTYDAVLKQMSDEQKKHAEDEYLRQLRDSKK